MILNFMTFPPVFKQFSFKLLTLILCFQPIFVIAQDNTIWIKSNYTPFQDFLVFIEGSKPYSTSYADYLLTQRRRLAKNFKLKEKLLIAQELYLSGEEERAVKAFKQIADLTYQADWDKDDRRIILYSLLRMAQSEQETEKQKALLLVASDFSAFEINRENYSDYDLFPPPLMKELQQIQNKKNELSLNWNEIFPNHEIILLNGRKLEKNQILSLPQTAYKVTALSSSHKAWSKNTSLSKLAGQKIQTQSLTKGACHKLEVVTDIQHKNIKLTPVSSCPDFNILKTTDTLAVNPNDLEPKTTPSQKKLSAHWPSWLILGASVVALSLAISLGENKNKNKSEDYVY